MGWAGGGSAAVLACGSPAPAGACTHLGPKPAPPQPPPDNPHRPARPTPTSSAKPGGKNARPPRCSNRHTRRCTSVWFPSVRMRSMAPEWGCRLARAAPPLLPLRCPPHGWRRCWPRRRCRRPSRCCTPLQTAAARGCCRWLLKVRCVVLVAAASGQAASKRRAAAGDGRAAAQQFKSREAARWPAAQQYQIFVVSGFLVHSM
jgi:hypothetical protein